METQQLEELKISIYEKLRRAIIDGNKEKALELLDESNRNRQALLDVYLTWADLLLTYIADKLGEDAVNDTMRIYDRQAVRPFLKDVIDAPSPDDRLRKRTYVMTSFYGINFDEIQEDDEKFIIKFKCPSGGVVRTREQFGKTREAYPWSWGEKGMAYYCTHCANSFEIMTIEQLGYPAWVVTTEPGGHCMQYIYKDPESVPEEYYKRVGMVKKKTG